MPPPLPAPMPNASVPACASPLIVTASPRSLVGLGSRSYSAWLASSLQQAFGRDQRTRTLAFDDVRIDLWLDADGRATRAQMVRGTGNAAIDDAVLAMLRDFRAEEKPPASLRYPLSMSIRGRRP
ncbi:TonB family protein, partial [Pandoraea apista]|uniref:energy transducer TonB family protein n=2 Tax=Pandoraea apista TaxID=93218 RepID=UPI000F67796B